MKDTNLKALDVLSSVLKRGSIPDKFKTVDNKASGVIKPALLNSSVRSYMETHRGYLPELQCFATVYVGGRIGGERKRISVDSWTSFSVPQPAINFKSDPTTMYAPVFAGVNGSELLSVSYNDFSDLVLTSFLWELYSSQFTQEGFLIRGGDATSIDISYVFHNYYDSNVKGVHPDSVDGKKPDFLWMVEFQGVVLREPQATGFSQSMGVLSRSFSFLYNRYDVLTPKLG